MKETVKRLAIKFGKKVGGAVMSAIAMLIGELVIGTVAKGFKSFKAARLTAKTGACESDDEAAINNENEIVFPLNLEEELPAETEEN